LNPRKSADSDQRSAAAHASAVVRYIWYAISPRIKKKFWDLRPQAIPQSLSLQCR